MLKHFRNAFFTGLVILLPLGFTVFVVNFLIQTVGAPSSKVFFYFLDPALRQHAWVNPVLDIISTVVAAILIMFLGLISQYFFGRLFVSLTEKTLNALPFVGTLYKTAKQIVDTFSKQKKAVFQKVVLVNYPMRGTFALGFLTSTAKGEIQEKTEANVVNVFVPTTPNPTSGFLLMVPQEEVIELDMKVSEGMKLVISGGAVVPDHYKNIEDIKSKKS